MEDKNKPLSFRASTYLIITSALLAPSVFAQYTCGVNRGNLHHYISDTEDKLTCTVFDVFELGPNLRTTQQDNDYAFYAPTFRLNGPISIGEGDTLTLGLPNKRRLNDTGILTCEDSSGTNKECPVEFYPGQDAEFGRDADFLYDPDGRKSFSYTTMGRFGNPWVSVPGDEDPSGILQPSCIKDNVTGLIWERKTNVTFNPEIYKLCDPDNPSTMPAGQNHCWCDTNLNPFPPNPNFNPNNPDPVFDIDPDQPGIQLPGDPDYDPNWNCPPAIDPEDPGDPHYCNFTKDEVDEVLPLGVFTWPTEAPLGWPANYTLSPGASCNILEQVPDLRHVLNTYTWYDGNTKGTPDGGSCSSAGYGPGEPYPIQPHVKCDTKSYIDTLNEYQLCGLSDWRLPTRTELRSLAEYSIAYPGPVADTNFFPNWGAQGYPGLPQPVSLPYWTANADPYEDDYAWLLDFAYGEINWDFMNHGKFVRAVHDPLWMPPMLQQTPIARQTCDPMLPKSTDISEFTDNGDGTVTHKSTGLMWKKCIEGKTGVNCELDDPNTPAPLTWRWALEQAKQSTFAGHDDWRMPNIKELASIVEASCYEPAINTSVFPNDPGERIWSSSSYTNYPSYQWVMDFAYGIDEQQDKSQGDTEYFVRLVRDASQREPVNITTP